jgi:hypothetical protein
VAAEGAAEAETAEPVAAEGAAEAETAEPVAEAGAAEAESAEPVAAEGAAEAESAEPVAEADEPTTEAAADEVGDPRLAALRGASSPTAPSDELQAMATIQATPLGQAQAGRSPEDDAQRRTARDASVEAAAAAREAAARAAAEKVAAVNAALAAESEFDVDFGADTARTALADEGAQASGRYLAPSATHQTLSSIGAGRPAAASIGPTGPAVATAYVPPRTPAPVQGAGLLMGRAVPSAAGRPPVPTVVPITTADRIKATLASIAAEPKSELVVTGLTALGGAIGLVSFFLPWTAQNGMGVGTVDAHPRPGAWAFDTAGGWPIFLITVILLGLILASDRVEELVPALAPTIRRLTEVVLPMLLGGTLLGVGLLYQLLPWGCGGGILPLMFGAVLLVAGSIVGLFFPAGERRG